MSNTAWESWNKAWGHKMTAHSAFRGQAKALDVLLSRVPDSLNKGFARLAAATLKQALIDAEREVEDDPDSFGPEQEALLSRPVDPDLIDMVALHCESLDLDVVAFRDSTASTLDLIADRVRAERAAAPSAEVICIAEARQRREAALAAEAPVILVPVRSRRRLVGEQYAWAI